MPGSWPPTGPRSPPPWIASRRRWPGSAATSTARIRGWASCWRRRAARAGAGRMRMTAVRRPARLEGVLELPGDKSVSHRALILNSIATGEAQVENLSPGADVVSTADCLRALGVEIEAGRVAGRGFDGLRPAAGPLAPRAAGGQAAGRAAGGGGGGGAPAGGGGRGGGGGGGRRGRRGAGGVRGRGAGRGGEGGRPAGAGRGGGASARRRQRLRV